MSSPATDVDEAVHARLMAAAERIRATGETEPRSGRDPVNQPMVNNWLEAIGDTDPRWTQGEAPPAMAQVWWSTRSEPNSAASFAWSTAKPTELAMPWSSGPVIVSMPGAKWYSGCPAVFEPSWRKFLISSIVMSS